jgi:hypothetical protein
MEITCLNCHHTWQLTSGQFLAARLKFALGAQEQAFACPNCQTENKVSEHTFRTSDPQRPVMAENDPRKPIPQHPARADNDPAAAPTNPITAPEPASSKLHAIVLKSGLPLRREHHRNAEIMGQLREDEHVIILDTWSNGDDMWIQLGPERWSPIAHDGEALIKLLED